MRRILRAELRETSRLRRFALAGVGAFLPETDFERLVAETKMAGAWLAASAFTKSTLVENGIPAERIHVVPYGVNLERFHPRRVRLQSTGPLKLLFVGPDQSAQRSEVFA